MKYIKYMKIRNKINYHSECYHSECMYNNYLACKMWTTNDLIENKITTTHKYYDLRPNVWYNILMDKELPRIFQQNQIQR